MAALLLIMNREPERWPDWLLAVFLAWFVTAAIIALASPLARLLGRKGLIAIERLMGMLLVGIAVQMLMTGIAQFIASVKG
jgi:multiple antibiotic resistance protein